MPSAEYSENLHFHRLWNQGSANCFSGQPGSKYFRLCGPQGPSALLCCSKAAIDNIKQISTTDLSIPIKPFVQRQAMAGFGLSAMVCQSLSSILQTAFALYIFLLMASLRVEVVLILPILQM